MKLNIKAPCEPEYTNAAVLVAEFYSDDHGEMLTVVTFTASPDNRAELEKNVPRD